jgi:hypothetical protein
MVTDNVVALPFSQAILLYSLTLYTTDKLHAVVQPSMTNTKAQEGTQSTVTYFYSHVILMKSSPLSFTNRYFPTSLTAKMLYVFLASSIMV